MLNKFHRRSMASDVKLKDMHGSGQGGTWRASEISS
jgi:hypothetical protein